MEIALSIIRKKLIINFTISFLLLVFIFSAMYFQVYLLPELEDPFPTKESVELALNTSDAKKLKEFILIVTETNEETQRDLIKMINTMFFAFYGVVIIALTTFFTYSLSIIKLMKNTEAYEKNHQQKAVVALRAGTAYTAFRLPQSWPLSMNMKILKLITGAVLLLSFILPLSTCSGVVEEGSNREPERVERYLISTDNTIVEWVLAVSFVFPFSISVYTFGKSSSNVFEFLSLVSVFPPAYLLWWHSVSGVLAWAAYFLIAVLFGYFISSLICLTRNLNQTRGTKVPLR